MSISQYNSLKENPIKCNICGEATLKRVFGSTNSNIERSSEEIKDSMREEVMSHVEKVRNGDISSISDIYGQELNKLKAK
jgi:hypothetical protein